MEKTGKMRRRVFTSLLIAAAIPWLIASCGFKTGVEQSAERSYLKFTGSISGAFVSIDEGEPFDLAKATHYTGQQGEDVKARTMLFEIKPGKHTVVVSRDGQVIVNRVFLIGNNQIKEIAVP